MNGLENRDYAILTNKTLCVFTSKSVEKHELANFWKYTISISTVYVLEGLLFLRRNGREKLVFSRKNKTTCKYYLTLESAHALKNQRTMSMFKAYSND